VLLVLPQLVPAPEPAQRPLPASEPPGPSAEHRDAERAAAEQALRDFLRLRARLDLAGAPRWGEPEWSEAARRADSGDRMFARQRFGLAGQRYVEALGSLERLEAERPQRLAAALEAGRRALASDQPAAAVAQLERALSIEPDHPGAREELKRARVREQVLGWVARGRQAELDGDLGVARAAYRRALQLDRSYAAAGSALARVQQQIDEQAFRRAMSEALAALDGGRLAEAREALGRATALKPGDSGVRDAGRRLERAAQRAQLERLRSAATDEVERENWGAARRLYQRALSLESGAAFARQGLTQARERARVHRQLDQYLDDPTRLYSPEPRAAAERLLASLGATPSDQPRLAEKLERLRLAVEEAATPLPVTLRSDGETEVVIYHVGRLGRFQSRRLELRPGNYTAVGSRPGYRDVRRVFSVRPGEPPPPVQLRCEEPV
jgi:hypothetical protein